MLDDLTAGLLESLSLQDRLDAALHFFVPRLAHAAWIRIDAEGAETRSAARGARRAHVPGRHVALRTNDTYVGTLHLDLTPAGSAVDPATLDALGVRIARAIEHSLAFEREQRVSFAFQYAALAPALPEIAGFRLDAVYEAGSSDALVGGDWYDAFLLPDGRLIVSIGDVVGSGLRAAVAMVSVRQSLRTIAHVNADPALMLAAANRTLQDEFPGRFVTTFVALIDPVTHLCAYVNAGHPPPFLRLANGDCVQLPCGGLPLGLQGFSQYAVVNHLTLPAASVLLLYTDGLTEATRNVLEGEERVHNALTAVDASMPEIAGKVYRQVLASRARDDVAIVSVAVERDADVLRWRFDPRWNDVAMRARREIAQVLQDAGMDSTGLFRFNTIFAELVANMIRYAPGTAEILLQRHDDSFVLHALDKGPGFTVAPRLPNDLFSERGRGLYLISKLADGFSVDRRPGGGSHARITLALRGETHA